MINNESILPHILTFVFLILVLNFAVLARKYFVVFYFRNFNRQIWRKGIKFRDLSVLNFILFLKKSEPLMNKKCVKSLQTNVKYFSTEDTKWNSSSTN